MVFCHRDTFSDVEEFVYDESNGGHGKEAYPGEAQPLMYGLSHTPEYRSPSVEGMVLRQM